MITKTDILWLAVLISFALTAPCRAQPQSPEYSYFGTYQPLPAWSGWCLLAKDPKVCEEDLTSAVTNPTANSRPKVRHHGWHLWAAMTTPLELAGYDAVSDTYSNLGSTGCWGKSSTGKSACSGTVPLWFSWPNTGVPYGNNNVNTLHSGHLLRISRKFGNAQKKMPTVSAAASPPPPPKIPNPDPDPTKVQSVNTTYPPVPAYPLPWLAVAKQCGLPAATAKVLVAAANPTKPNSPAWKKLATACMNKVVICAEHGQICDGSAFVNQGDVMIATESVSSEAWNAIQKFKLYGINGNTPPLSNIYMEDNIENSTTKVASLLDHGFISTKNMFWPVKGCKPHTRIGQAGCRVRYGALPPWIPTAFKKKNYATNAEYLGYEKWGKVVAIDTCGKQCPAQNRATLKLEGVTGANAISTKNPAVYDVHRFSHIQISDEILTTRFTAADRALLDQATIWAYGSDSNGFEAGDFLVVVAMHVSTKEIDSWGFQSAWWSPMNDKLADCPSNQYKNCYGQHEIYNAQSRYSGLDKTSISEIDKKVGTVWRQNYLLADSYAIPYEIDGKKTDVNHYFAKKPPIWATQRPTGEKVAMLPIAMNVYIEPVIHPLGTNCHNCHSRAGLSTAANPVGMYSAGFGQTNYQTAQCPSLLADYGMPANNPCMTTPWAWNMSKKWNNPAKNQCSQNAQGGTKCNKTEAFPVVNTDFSWIIGDGHIQQAK